jgi:DNA polymerase-4
MKDEISRLVTGLSPRIDRSKAKGRTITLKLKDSDFNTNTRSRSLAYFTENAVEIQQIAYELLMQDLPSEPIRLLGVSLSNLHFMSDEELGYQLMIDF